MRVKIIKNYRQYKAGEVKTLKAKTALSLIQEGVAIMTKDIMSGETWLA